jgi:hypothetical protein
MGFAGVIKQGINGFLQKSLFVIYDAFGRSDFPHFLEPIVSVDDSAVKVIEVTGGEPSTQSLDRALWKSGSLKDTEKGHCGK